VPVLSKEPFWQRGIFVGLVCLTFLIYMPSLQNEFVNWDDDDYVLDNPNVHEFNLRTLTFAITETHASNWHPLTWLSHAFDYKLYGTRPFGHHLTSVLIHSANVGLVFLLVLKLLSFINISGREDQNSDPSFYEHRMKYMVAMLSAYFFACHPVHVESVSWVSERKDVLCAFFYLASVITYLHSRTSRLTYSCSIFFFLLAVLSKPMAVSLPVILLILDFYPLRRFEKGSERRKIWLEKTPYVVIAGISCVITLFAQQESMVYLDMLPVMFRLANACFAISFYLFKMIVPLGLAPFYPLPKDAPMIGLWRWFAMISVPVLAILSLKRPPFRSLWLVYLVLLLPVLGLVQVGMQTAADRYMYLPSIPVFLALSLGMLRMI